MALEFKLHPLKHPYPDEESAMFELWGEIKLLQDGKEVFIGQWDVITFIEWFIQRQSKLKAEAFPLENYSLFESSTTDMQPYCIAEKFDKLRSELINIDEEINSTYYDNILAEYWENHFFLLRGSKLPGFFIGINNGTGEISWFEDGLGYTSTVFDMNDFLESTSQEIEGFIIDWKVKHYSLEVLERLRNIGYKC